MKKHPESATVRLRRGLCYVLVTLLILVLSGYAAGLILFRGPSKQLNTLVKYTLLETRRFGFIPYLFLSEEEVMSLIDYVDALNVKHGATTEVYSTSTPEARALERRIRDLTPLLRQCRELASLTEHYYEGSCRRYERYRL